MSLLHTPRMFSNKENGILSPTGCMPSFLPSSSSIAKPVLRGLGRSPRKRGAAHGSKPYARTSSVHKPTTSVNTPSKSKKGKKAAPPPLMLSAITKKPATRPRAAVVVVQSQVQIPLVLPRVDIPPVPHLCDDFDAGIPFEFVRARLLPRLAAFGIVSSQYRPFPSVHQSPLDASGRATMAFGVPAIVEGKDTDGGLAARMQGREPDLCLAITRKGDATLKATASLVPVNKLVFSSQCFHWSRLTERAPAVSPSHERAPSPVAASSASDLDVKPILEDIEEADELEGDNRSDTSSDLSDAPTITSFHPDSPKDCETDTKPPLPQFPPSPFLHLPIQPLALPSPETYSHLHNLLHFTHSPPPSTFSPLAALLGSDIAALHNLENKDLMKKLAVIQGVWKNCCFLGVSDAKIWNAMGDAWGAVVGIVAERSKRANAMDMSQ